MFRLRSPRRRGAVAALASLAVSLAPSLARADVTAHPLFADHMVLQREAKAPVWGTADPNEEVTVAVAGQTHRTKADGFGRWQVRLKPLAAGGPHELSVKGPKNEVRFTDVLVGDVWLCSGQSNMEWPISRSDNAQQEAAAATDPRIRLFSVPHVASDTPQQAVAAKWEVCSPESVPQFSAVGYFFGRHLRQSRPEVPVGLIDSSWGGTVAEAWTDATTLQASGDGEFLTLLRLTGEYPQQYPAALRRWEEARKAWQEESDKAKAEGRPFTRQAPRRPAEPGKNPNLATVLYNGMIRPLQPFAIKGAIWYQGESNAGRAYQYRRLLPAMVNGWRRTWDQGDFPFLIVQLANFGGNGTPGPDGALPGSNWAELREAQAITAVQVKNAGMAVTLDIGNPNDIHPTNKQEVGRRLGLVADAKVYGRKGVVHAGPAYKALRLEGDKVRLKFDGAENGLAARDNAPLQGFTVAGADGRFFPAEATIEGRDTVIVRSAQVAKPVAVRYGWANSPVATLTNKEGLPAAPFRTDDWPGVTWPKPAGQ